MRVSKYHVKFNDEIILKQQFNYFITFKIARFYQKLKVDIITQRWRYRWRYVKRSFQAIG